MLLPASPARSNVYGARPSSVFHLISAFALVSNNTFDAVR
jgi:hypothetical protein